MPEVLFGAVMVAETFESYANGNNLNGLNGGSGWSGAWSESSAGSYQITNVSADGGLLSVRHSSVGLNGVEPTASRTFSTTYSSDEVFAFSMMRDTNSNVDTNDVRLLNGGNLAARLFYQNSNYTISHNGGSTTLVAGATAGQWYTFRIKLGASSFQISVDGGAYLGPFTYSSSVSTGVNNVLLLINAANNGDYNFYIDEIGDGVAVVPAVPPQDTTYFEVLEN